ncbi:MAG: hypothetical protein HQL64_02165 [Magnetococcales bacterium]|nr:hypothetical protein [Magnetococcales bacterium]
MIEKPSLPLFSFLATGLIFIALTATTWLRWADPVMDFGRELYYPWQILHGKILQRDLYQIFGPFSDYFNALWMAIGGETAHTLFIVNLILAACATFVILSLFGTWLGWLPGFLAALGFMVLGVFSHTLKLNSFNFIAPYGHAATHGFIVALTALTALLSYVRRGNTAGLYVAALLTGICFLIKPEYFLALVVSGSAVALGMAACYPLRWQDSLRHAMGVLLTFFLPSLLFFGYFLTVLPLDSALQAVGGAWMFLKSGYVVSSYFQKTISGINHLERNLFLALFSAAILLGWTLTTYWVSRVKVHALPTLLICFIALTWPLLFVLRHGWSFFSVVLVPRGLMIFTCLTLVLIAFGYRMARTDHKTREPMFFMGIWSIFSLTLLLRKFFDTTLTGYGFVLVTPAFLGFIGLLTGMIPLWMTHRGDFGRAKMTRGIHTAFVVFVVAGVWHCSQAYHQRTTYEIGTGNNRMLALPPSIYLGSLVHAHVAHWARQQLRSGETLVAIPDGLIFNFFYQAINPTRVYSFLPSDLAWKGENYFIEEIQRGRPRYILFWSRPTEEYGYPFMGSPNGFGLGIIAWLKQNYRPVYHEENGFSLDHPEKKGLIILKTREDDGQSPTR